MLLAQTILHHKSKYTVVPRAKFTRT